MITGSHHMCESRFHLEIFRCNTHTNRHTNTHKAQTWYCLVTPARLCCKEVLGPPRYCLLVKRSQQSVLCGLAQHHCPFWRGVTTTLFVLCLLRAKLQRDLGLRPPRCGPTLQTQWVFGKLQQKLNWRPSEGTSYNLDSKPNNTQLRKGTESDQLRPARLSYMEKQEKSLWNSIASVFLSFESGFARRQALSSRVPVWCLQPPPPCTRLCSRLVDAPPASLSQNWALH